MVEPSSFPQTGTVEAVALVKEPAILPTLTDKEFRIITESAIDGIVVMDHHGRVTHWNPAAEKTFGWNAEEILGKSIHGTITPPEFRKAAFKGIEHFFGTGKGPLLESTRTVIGLRKDGTRFPLEISLSAFKIEGKWWAAAFTRDVTERYEAEREMQNYAAALEEANRKLREMREKAEEANISKSRFLANMSHEIRTPLNGIMGFTTMLLDTDLDHEQVEYTTTIYKSGELLLETINNILDFSKIEAGQLRLENTDFNLRDVLQNIITLLTIKSNEKKIQLFLEIDNEVPPLLRGDPLRISQILLNLMSNAVKFTEHGNVTVQILADEVTPQNVNLRIHVSDTGIGIPADKIESLFEPFVQVDTSTTRKYGGTGLGLTICQRLVELMNGQIQVTSPAIRFQDTEKTMRADDQEGPGTTFTVLLSLARQADVDEKRLQKETGKSPGQFDREVWRQEPIHARALIAEDNPINQKLLVKMLEKFGMETVSVANGQEAINALKKETFDIVMMDYEMPLLNGIEATRLIRTGESMDTTIPIIILTAHAMKEDRMLCIASGANEYITKPFHPDMIYKTMVKLIGPHGTHRTVCPTDKKTTVPLMREEQSCPDTGKPTAYDHDQFLQLCGNDQGLADELISLFLETHTVMVASIEESLHSKRTNSVVKTAHKLKGSLRTLYAHEAAQAAAVLETAARDGEDWKKLQDQFAVLQEKLQILLRQLLPNKG